MPVLMINPFQVFEGREEDFLVLWDQTHDIFKTKEGYLSTRLCKAHDLQPPGQGKMAFTHLMLLNGKVQRGIFLH